MWRALNAAIWDGFKAEMPPVPKATSWLVVRSAIDCSGDKTDICAGVSAETCVLDNAAICAGIMAATWSVDIAVIWGPVKPVTCPVDRAAILAVGNTAISEMGKTEI